MVSQTLEMKPSRLTLIVLSVATLAAGQTCDNFVRCVQFPRTNIQLCIHCPTNNHNFALLLFCSKSLILLSDCDQFAPIAL